MLLNLTKSLKFALPVLALTLLVTVGCGAKDAIEKGKSAVGDGAKLTEMLGSVTGALGDVKDEASATAAASTLKDVTSKLDGLGIDKLPASVKDKAVSGFKSKVDGMLEKLYAIPGAQAVLKPVIEGLMSKLGA